MVFSKVFVLACFVFVFSSTVDSSSSDSGSSSSDEDVKFISLCQSDFEDGTVIIDEANTMVELSCDIIFNPKSDWVDSPNEEGAYFCEAINSDIFEGCDNTPGSFRLGFFAAISIEADNVIFDLNNHILAVDQEFALQQRFFTLISVGQGPFIKGQGPSSFGENINVTNIKIYNGELGLSPHHGIHGNLMSNIEISDLKIYDFEVAGIQLNGFTNAYLHDIEIGPSLYGVPVLGRYSQARFDFLAFRDIKERLEQLSSSELNNDYIVDVLNVGKDGSDGSLNVVEIMQRLIDGMDLYFDYKINGIVPDNDEQNKELRQLWRESVNLFDNDVGGFPDGSAVYGILLNSAGVAVDWFGARSSVMNENLVLSDIVIKDLNLKVKEVIGYINSAGSVVTGPFKGVLPMDLLLDLDSFDPNTFDLSRDSFENYHGNMLSDAQIGLAMFADNSDELQGTTIDEEFINWARGTGNLTNGKLVCNGDDMFHMNKGVVGIRIDRTNNVEMKNVVIENINNWSEFGSKFCQTRNNNNSNSSYPFDYCTHPQTPSKSDNNINFKYQGRVVRGMALTDVTGIISLEDVEIDSVNSARGSAIGIDILGTQVSVVNLGDIRIDDINAGSELTEEEQEFPNDNVYACGLYVTNPNGDFIHDGNNDIVDVDGPEICLGSLDLR